MDDPVLTHFKDFLQDAMEDYDAVASQLRDELNPETQNKLKRKLENLREAMDGHEATIRERQVFLDNQAVQESVDRLIFSLEQYPGEQAVYVEAYGTVLCHWPTPINSSAETPAEILAELARIPSSNRSVHSARDEFIARVIRKTAAPALADGLQQWLQTYRPAVVINQVYAVIDQQDANQQTDIQPAILIKIVRSDQGSTQATDGEPRYEIRAWLIEDIDTYKAKKTGYHPLIQTDSEEAAPKPLNKIEASMSRLLNNCVAAKNSICGDSKNEPEVHVFLPLELMDWAVDSWELEPAKGRQTAKCVGHSHVTVLRCTSRYENTYQRRSAWLRLWGRHQELLAETSQTVMLAGHDEDLDTLLDNLEAELETDDSKTVGLHVTDVPMELEVLCDELLFLGLPLVVWPRQTLGANAQGKCWADLLSGNCLDDLPKALKNERSRARRKKLDGHHGHHLSLLRDDPDLFPPQSA